VRARNVRQCLHWIGNGEATQTFAESITPSTAIRIPDRPRRRPFPSGRQTLPLQAAPCATAGRIGMARFPRRQVRNNTRGNARTYSSLKLSSRCNRRSSQIRKAAKSFGFLNRAGLGVSGWDPNPIARPPPASIWRPGHGWRRGGEVLQQNLEAHRSVDVETFLLLELPTDRIVIDIVVDGLQPAVTCKNFTKQVAFMRRHLVDDTASPFAQFLCLFTFSGRARDEQIEVTLNSHVLTWRRSGFRTDKSRSSKMRSARGSEPFICSNRHRSPDRQPWLRSSPSQTSARWCPALGTYSSAPQ
jgi:hypothetical protein